MKKFTIENLVPIPLRTRSLNCITINCQGIYIPMDAAQAYGINRWKCIVCFHYDVNSFGLIGYETINDVPHSFRKDMVSLQSVYAKGNKDNPYAYRIASKSLADKYGTTKRLDIEVIDVAGVSGLLLSTDILKVEK